MARLAAAVPSLAPESLGWASGDHCEVALGGADLSDAEGVTKEQLEQQASSLKGATMVRLGDPDVSREAIDNLEISGG